MNVMRIITTRLVLLKCTGTLTAQHVVICIVCDGVDMWGRLRAPFAFVGRDHGRRVDWQPFIRIDGHTEKAGVGLRKQVRTQCQLPLSG